MSTVRGVKDRRFKFVQLLNSMFEDQNLSLKAKGFIGYCLTKPDEWRFHIQHLVSVLKEGEKAIYSTIDECIEQGYAIRFQRRKENGDFAEWETIISDSKHEIFLIKEELDKDPDFKKCLPHRHFGDAQKRDADVAPHSNTNNSVIQKEQQQQIQHNIDSQTQQKKNYQTRAAAVSFEKKNEMENVRIYGNLKKIDIPELDKVEITQKYSEIVVKNAIDWATHPQTKLNKGLAPAIKWACQTKPEVPKNAIDEVESNKKAATELLKRLKCPQFVRVEILHKKAEIVFENCSKEPICISYTEKGFMPQFESSLRKVGCSLMAT